MLDAALMTVTPQSLMAVSCRAVRVSSQIRRAGASTSISRRSLAPHAPAPPHKGTETTAYLRWTASKSQSPPTPPKAKNAQVHVLQYVS